jgi:uncharacterized protein (DUF433 family)
MLEGKVSDLTVDEFRVLVREVVRQTLAEMRNAGELPLDDPKFPLITYRRGGSGTPRPVIRGTAIHVQTLILWIQYGESPEKVAADYNLDIKQVREAQAFYKAHKAEIDADIQAELDLEAQHKSIKVSLYRRKSPCPLF